MYFKLYYRILNFYDILKSFIVNCKTKCNSTSVKTQKRSCLLKDHLQIAQKRLKSTKLNFVKLQISVALNSKLKL